MSLPLAPLADPFALGKLQILLIPIHLPNQPPLTETIYNHWASLFKRTQVLRGDEISRPTPIHAGHVRGGGAGGFTSSARARFLPPSSGTSIARTASNHHLHLAYPTGAPARHLYPLSLLRVAGFPLVVIGICVDQGEGSLNGYTVDEQEEDGEGVGDVGRSRTPTGARNGDFQGAEMAFRETVSNHFPPTSPFPLVKRLIIVSPTIPTSPGSKSSTPRKGGRNSDGIGVEGEVVRAPEGGVDAGAVRFLGEVVGAVLGELGELASALETPSGLNTLSSTLLPSLTSTLPSAAPPPNNRYPGIPRTNTPGEIPHRSTSTTPIPLPHSQSLDSLSGIGLSLTRALTPGGRPTSVGPPSLPPIHSPTPNPPIPEKASSNPFRMSSAITSPFTRATSTSTSSISSSSSASVSATATATSVGGSRYTAAPLTGVAGGRLMKLLGDMYLLAGMYVDAIRCFDEGAERCRGVGDVLWEGVAREGRAVAGIGEAWEGRDGSNTSQPFPSSPIPVEILSHFLSSLACLSRSPLPYPPTILAPSPQAASGSISFGPRLTPSGSTGTGEGLLAYLHTGLSLRISHFVLIIWAASGWGSIALSSIVGHALPRSFPPLLLDTEIRDPTARRKRSRVMGLLSSRSGLERHSILSHAEVALAPHHRALTKAEQLALHIEVVWLTRYLDCARKEAWATREVVKRVSGMILENREESRRNRKSRPPDTTLIEPVPDPASVGLGLGMTILTNPSVGVRRKESVEGNESLIKLFYRIADIMGVDLIPLTQSSTGESTTTTDATSVDDTTVGRSKFGWPEVQVDLIKEGIALSESLPDHLALIRLCTSALKSLHGYLNATSQGHLCKVIPRALGVVRRRAGRGIGVGVGWWVPGKLVLSLEIAGLPANRLPVEHAEEEIVKGKEVFLYNPRLKAVEVGKTIIVANEQVDIFVTLQNPFLFDLEIQHLSLITSGIDFASSPVPINIPASSLQTVRLSGIASTPGTLQIRGVSIRLAGGSAIDALLPVIDEAEKIKRDKRKSRAMGDSSRIKKSGMEARFAPVTPDGDGGSGGEKWLECRNVEDQPLLWIRKTNLTHGTMMLYNGESSTLRITLENSSSTPVDFIKLSFDASTSRQAQAIISEGELSPEQAYELEYDILRQPVFTWENEGEMGIPPGGRLTLQVRCLGKVGCTDGSIRIDYGLVNRPQSGEKAGTFHTRSITFPTLFTVYHTLEPHSLDVTRFANQSSSSPPPSSSSDSSLLLPNGITPSRNGSLTPIPLPRRTSFAAIEEDLLKIKLGEEGDNDHRLVSISVRNVYGVPFEVVVSRRVDGEDDLEASRLVPPGATERIILPLPRISLSSKEWDKPIPSLAERQYVVEKTKKTREQIRQERRLFWYREELLNMLEATWIEPGSKRNGTLSLRDQVFTPTLLENFKVDDLEIGCSISSRKQSTIKMSEFVDIVVKVVNHLEEPIRPFIRLEPLPSSSTDTSWSSPTTTATPPPRRPQSTLPPMSTKNILLDGVLGQIAPLLQPGEIAEMKVGAMFLASGQYAFRAAVEEVRLDGQHDPSPPKLRFSPLLHVDVSL